MKPILPLVTEAQVDRAMARATGVTLGRTIGDLRTRETLLAVLSYYRDALELDLQRRALSPSAVAALVGLGEDPPRPLRRTTQASSRAMINRLVTLGLIGPLLHSPNEFALTDAGRDIVLTHLNRRRNNRANP